MASHLNYRRSVPMASGECHFLHLNHNNWKGWYGLETVFTLADNFHRVSSGQHQEKLRIADQSSSEADLDRCPINGPGLLVLMKQPPSYLHFGAGNHAMKSLQWRSQIDLLRWEP